MTKMNTMMMMKRRKMKLMTMKKKRRTRKKRMNLRTLIKLWSLKGPMLLLLKI